MSHASRDWGHCTGATTSHTTGVRGGENEHRVVEDPLFFFIMSSNAAPWSATQPAQEELQEIDEWFLEALEEPTRAESGGVDRNSLGSDDGPGRTIEV